MAFFDEESQELYSPPAKLKLSWISIQYIPVPSDKLQKLLYTPPVSLSVCVPCGIPLHIGKKCGPLFTKLMNLLL